MYCFTAGAVTGAITTPLDVIKTRLMTQVLEMKVLNIIVALFCISMHSTFVFVFVFVNS